MLVNLEVLRVHLVIFYIVLPHRLEGSRTYMECNETGIDPLFPALGQEFFTEVQAGCGRGNGTLARSVNGLVSLPVQIAVSPDSVS